MVTYEQIKNNAEINCYIQKANEHLKVLGYTDHSKIHCLRVVAVAEKILTALRYDERKSNLPKLRLICTISGIWSTATTMPTPAV